MPAQPVLYRQGDVLLRAIDAIPDSATFTVERDAGRIVLAYGEVTGHAHAIVAPEGRIHFAGEHASLTHAWIQGAIESGVRAAAEIHERALAIA